MTNYGMIRKDRQSMIDFFDKYVDFDGSPWMNWFDKKYCKKCKPIIIETDDGYLGLRKHSFSFCELNEDKCIFFQKLDKSPDNKMIIDMWLDEEVE